ncbi:MAG TPA: M1 family aminopeptidase [Azonexus sp.]|nr:M1 family aminopeptidase [Azonexus sp.]
MILRRLADLLRRLLTLWAFVLAAGVAAATTPSLTLDISLEPASRQLEAVAIVRPMHRDFRFVLHESLNIRSAEANGKALKFDAQGKDEALQTWHIRLPKASETLRITYGGTLQALQNGRDHRSVLRAMPPMAAVDGSYLPSSSGWYPQPAPMFSYRLKLSLPADQRALVPGRLLEEKLPEGASGRYLAAFEFTQLTDGIDLMAGPWRIREKTVPQDGKTGSPALRLRTYFPAALDAEPGLADAYLEDSRRYIERYSSEIGAYPYSEFSVVASPLPTGFGMPTLTYIGVDVLKLPFIRATSLGHEILHNWWGNGVYVNYAQGNWSEGLTTFMADYAFKEGAAGDSSREMRLGWLRDFSALSSEARLPLREFRGRTHSASAAVGYGKAAMLFVMLRDQIGEKAFRQGIRDFWSKNRFRVATWQDLQLAFEGASGRDLKPFFKGWLDASGAPKLEVRDAVLKAAGSGYQLNVLIKQQGAPLVTRLPLELSAGTQRETRWVSVKQASESVKIDLEFRPRNIRIDPDIRLWRHLDPKEMPPILRQWIGAPTPRLLIAASGVAADAAATLAERFFEVKPQNISSSNLTSGLANGEPIMIIGTHTEVAASLAAAGLPGRPAELANRGSAQVWTLLRATGAPVAVVSADDAKSLQALARPLPHYGGQSWLVFADSKSVDRGIWPVSGVSVAIKDAPPNK